MKIAHSCGYADLNLANAVAFIKRAGDGTEVVQRSEMEGLLIYYTSSFVHIWGDDAKRAVALLDKFCGMNQIADQLMSGEVK